MMYSETKKKTIFRRIGFQIFFLFCKLNPKSQPTKRVKKKCVTWWMNAKSQHLETKTTTTATTTLHNTMEEKKERKFIKNYKQNKMGNKKNWSNWNDDNNNKQKWPYHTNKNKTKLIKKKWKKIRTSFYYVHDDYYRYGLICTAYEKNNTHKHWKCP